MDSSPTKHGRQGNQSQLSTADGTNEILSFPYKRENGTSREGENYLWKMATEREREKLC
jgi:hypothetical protein